MNVYRIRDREAIHPSHAVLIALVVLVVAGSCLLLSAAESTELVDGARPWQEESPLRAVVRLLCLDYRYPTINAGDVKMLIFGLGTGISAIALGIALTAGTRKGDEEYETDPTLADPQQPPIDESIKKKDHVTPLVAAQVLVGLFLLWSLASSRWSLAPQLAIGGTILFAIQFLWAIVLGNGLSSSASTKAGRAVVLITGVTALIAIWYWCGRNPEIRAKFPFGNPTFLAACLIPGILLAIAWIFDILQQTYKNRSAAGAKGAPFATATIVTSIVALSLAESRGPLLGLVFGLIAAGFFAFRGKAKILPVIAAIGVTVAVVSIFNANTGDDSLGRNTSLRFRQYSWSYALNMFSEKPWTGYGQGGFALRGDSYAIHDIADDPQIFTARIAHAHNEWLEIMADLGSMGIALVGGILLLTIKAGMNALRTNPSSKARWTLVALLGTLVGLIVEECSGVGLRVSGVPVMFYTVIGLIWAIAGHECGVYPLQKLASGPRRKTLLGLTLCLLGVASLILSQQDFAAARSTFKVQEHLARSDFDGAIAKAEGGTARLSPSRSLMNLFRLAEAHMLAAKVIQNRAIEREKKAKESDPPDNYRLGLAAKDYNTSEQHCIEGHKALSQLAQWSPRYINSGYLEYWLNRIRMRNPRPEAEASSVELYVTNAVAAIEREIQRQPYNINVALDYLRIAIDRLTPEQTVDVLARPLRYSELAGQHVDMLLTLTSNNAFSTRFMEITEQAKESLSTWDVTPPADRFAWAPELMRLAATAEFAKGRSRNAVDLMKQAQPIYDSLANEAAIGAASFYAEFAYFLFSDRPDLPQNAINAANRAIELAPKSEHGRAIALMVRQRMIIYHLAANEEDQARALLFETSPGNLPEEAADKELSSRYSKLCHDLLSRPDASQPRAPVATLPPDFAQWVDRALALWPQNHLAHYVAADLAFSSGDCPKTAHHIRMAIGNGMQLEIAWHFIGFARGEGMDCDELSTLWEQVRQHIEKAIAESKKSNASATPPPPPAPMTADPLQPITVEPGSDTETQQQPQPE